MAACRLIGRQVEKKGIAEMKMGKVITKKIKIILFTLILIIICSLEIAGCATEEPAAEKGKPVTTLRVEEQEKLLNLEYFGITDSRETKKYSFKMGGKIAGIKVDKGQKIEKGQILVELEKSDLQYAWKAAEYSMKKAESAAWDARDYYEKVKVLKENGALSQRDLDLARLDMEVKEADFNQARVDYEYKSSQLSDASLYADLEGYILEVFYQEGEVVSAGYPVIAVRSAEQVVNVGLSQEDVPKVRKGSRAVLIPAGSEGQEAQGEVILLDQLPDMESRTYNAQILITEGPADFAFYLGSTSRVQIEAGTVKGIWIPLSAIQNDGQDYVYVVRDNRALRKDIMLQDTIGTQVQVQGLKPGDQLITGGMKNLSDGRMVAEGEESHD